MKKQQPFKWGDRIIWNYVQPHSMIGTKSWSKRAIFIGYAYENPNVAVILCENQVTRTIAKVQHLKFDHETKNKKSS